MLKNNYTILFGISILLLTIGTISISDSFGDSHEAPELFTKINTNTIVSSFSLPSTITQDITSAIIETEIVSADLSILDNDSITVTLFDNTYTLENDSIDNRGAGDFAWFGSNDNVSAVITVYDGKTVGTFYTADGVIIVEPLTNEIDDLHLVKNVDTGRLVEAPHTMEDISLNSVAGHSDEYYNANWKEFFLTHDRFRPSNLNEMEEVTVDVYFGYTQNAKDEANGSGKLVTFAKNQLDKANNANKASSIPVKFIFAGSDDIRYIEEGLEADRINLLNHDAKADSGFIKHSALNNLRGDADRNKADILVLLTQPSSINNYGGCGIAGGEIAKHPHNSIAIVVYECLNGTTLTHEMGHLFGASHNRDYKKLGQNENPFGQFKLDGYGYYNINAKVRTVMSYDCDNTLSDYPDSDPRTPVTCIPQEVWSDPEINFHGTTTAAGKDASYNARVVFGTGPYMASLAGPAQSYDTTSPSGDFKWFDDLGKELGDAIKKIFNPGQTMSIKATFNEDIHNSYPPTVTISDGIITTNDLSMIKSSNTVYTASHLITGERGDVTLTFSNAKDLYLNDIVVNPTAGGTVTVIVPDTQKPVITLTGVTDPLEVGVETYRELGATVTDNDPTYSENVTVGGDTVDTSTVGSYTVTYNAPADAANNTPNEVTRVVIVQDTTKPVISLDGANPQSIEQGDTYSELEASCTDIYDGDISSIVIDASNVDTETLGTYQVTYDCADAAGNNATTEIRTVNVVYYTIDIAYDRDTQLLVYTWNLGDGDNCYVRGGVSAVNGNAIPGSRVGIFDCTDQVTFDLNYYQTDKVKELPIDHERRIVYMARSSLDIYDKPFSSPADPIKLAQGSFFFSPTLGVAVLANCDYNPNLLTARYYVDAEMDHNSESNIDEQAIQVKHRDDGTCTITIIPETPTDPNAVPTLRIVADNSANSPSDTFEFSITNSQTIVTNFETLNTGLTSTTNQIELIEGDQYSIIENTIPDNFELTNSDCTQNGVSVDTLFTPQLGDNITCTFQNTYTAPTVTLEIKAHAYSASSPVTFDFEITDNDGIIETTKQVIADVGASPRMQGTTGSFEFVIVPDTIYTITEMPHTDYKIWEYYGQELIFCSVNGGPQLYVDTFTGNDGDTIVCEFINVPIDY